MLFLMILSVIFILSNLLMVLKMVVWVFELSCLIIWNWLVRWEFGVIEVFKVSVLVLRELFCDENILGLFKVFFIFY